MRFHGNPIRFYDAIRILLPVRVLVPWAWSKPGWQCPVCACTHEPAWVFRAAARKHPWYCPGRYHLGLLGWWHEVAWPALRAWLAPIEISDMQGVRPQNGWIRVEHFEKVAGGSVWCCSDSDEVAHFKVMECAETRPVYYVRRAWPERFRAAFQ